jgi:hypothetical protein
LLEPLECRALPAFVGGAFVAPALQAAPVMSQPIVFLWSGRTTPINVTVAENTRETVIDMGPVFAAIPGFQHQDVLHLSVLGNTNSALVRTELSDSALILTYRVGHTGRATIVVCATDADGVSVRQTLRVTVCPVRAAGTTGAGSTLVAPSPSSARSTP